MTLVGFKLRFARTSCADAAAQSGELCALIAEYWSPVEREVYIAHASKLLELPPDVLKNSVEQIRKKKSREYDAKQSREAQASIKNFGDRINPDSAKDPRAGACGSLVDLPSYPLEAHPEITSGILQEESLALLRNFFKKIRRK